MCVREATRVCCDRTHAPTVWVCDWNCYGPGVWARARATGMGPAAPSGQGGDVACGAGETQTGLGEACTASVVGR